MIKVFVKQHEPYTGPITYILKLLAKNKGFEVLFVNENDHAYLVFDGQNGTVPLATGFYKAIEQGQYSPDVFRDDCLVRTAAGSPDYLATAFYMVNCLQELNAAAGCYDDYGRYKYESSYQHRFGNAEDNLVQHCFDLFCTENEALAALKPTIKPTRIFLSHDIDTVYGSLAQDGFWALNNLHIGAMLRIMASEVLRKPAWLNIDKILQIHSEYDIKSTFFWIVNKGLGVHNIKNADYAVQSAVIRQQLGKVSAAGSFNGLHKSCSNDTFPEELAKLPVPANVNRCHFLRFRLPELWEDLAASAIKMDASVGFAGMHGFRNSYGLPFSPYSFKEKKSYDFVEVPLQVMDTTFHKYQKIKITDTASTIINFAEKNRRNCVLSLLWHNTYFTEYKYGGYLDEYKKLLAYFYESKLAFTTPDEIIAEYL